MQYPYIIISLQEKRLTLHKNIAKSESFPIAIGKPTTPTPIGTWQIINKKILQEPSVYGTHWLGLSNTGYGIHGTNQPDAIGMAVSGGCIRMHNRHIQYLFNQISIGTNVTIID